MELMGEGWRPKAILQPTASSFPESSSMWIRWPSKHKGCSTHNHKPNFDPAAEELITARMDTFLNKTQSNDSNEPSRLVKLQTVKPPINIFRIRPRTLPKLFKMVKCHRALSQLQVAANQWFQVFDITHFFSRRWINRNQRSDLTLFKIHDRKVMTTMLPHLMRQTLLLQTCTPIS